MSSSVSKRAFRGQSRLEFAVHIDEITAIAASHANRKQVWQALKGAGQLTVSYPSFLRRWRECFADGNDPLLSASPVSAPEPVSAGQSGAPEAASRAGSVSPPASRPSMPEVKGFRMPRGTEGGSAW